MHSVDLNINVGMNYKLDFNKDRENVRRTIEEFIIQHFMKNGKQTIKQLGKEIDNTGFVGEYGETQVHLHFNLNSKNELEFCDDTSSYLDDTLIEEEWMDLSTYNNLTEEIRKLSYEVSSKYSIDII